MSTQEKSGGTLSSAFTKGEYTYRRRGSAVATGDIRITDPKSSADLNIVMDPQRFPRHFLGNIRSMMRTICNQGTQIENVVAIPMRSSQTRGLRHETQLAIDNSRLVTGMVTVNGNRIRLYVN